MGRPGTMNKFGDSLHLSLPRSLLTIACNTINEAEYHHFTGSLSLSFLFPRLYVMHCRVDYLYAMLCQKTMDSVQLTYMILYIQIHIYRLIYMKGQSVTSNLIGDQAQQSNALGQPERSIESWNYCKCNSVDQKHFLHLPRLPFLSKFQPQQLIRSFFHLSEQ